MPFKLGTFCHEFRRNLFAIYGKLEAETLPKMATKSVQTFYDNPGIRIFAEKTVPPVLAKKVFLASYWSQNVSPPDFMLLQEGLALHRDLGDLQLVSPAQEAQDFGLLGRADPLGQLLSVSFRWLFSKYNRGPLLGGRKELPIRRALYYRGNSLHYLITPHCRCF